MSSEQTNTEAEDLARLIVGVDHPGYDFDGHSDLSPVKFYARRTADAVIAAGWRKTRIVTTADELNALWLNAVILDRGGLARQAWSSSNGELFWEEPGRGEPMSSAELIEHITICGVEVAFDVLYNPVAVDEKGGEHV